MWLDVYFCGKKSEDIAKGIEYSLKQFGLPLLPPSLRVTVDSSAGTPESLKVSLMNIQLWGTHLALADSCGIHDIQSLFRLPIAQWIGEGGLDRRNTIQLIHTVLACTRF